MMVIDKVIELYWPVELVSQHRHTEGGHFGHFVKDFTKTLHFYQYSPPSQQSPPILSFSVHPCLSVSLSICHLNGQESFSLSTIQGSDLVSWPEHCRRPQVGPRQR